MYDLEEEGAMIHILSLVCSSSVEDLSKDGFQGLNNQFRIEKE